MTLTRLQYWETRAFHDFLLERAAMPFAWGVNDCALFAADGIRAITGVDIAADFRGYTDEAGAWAAIARVCSGSTVADAAAYCAETHGLVEWQHPRCAQRGDLVVFQPSRHQGPVAGDTGTAPAGSLVAGLVHLSGQIVAVGDQGLYLFPITSVTRAWHYE